MRETARAEGRPPLYDRRWRDRSPEEAPEGVNPVIRIKAPLEGEIRVIDHVQGEVVFKSKTSTISSFCGPMARRPICWPWSSTTTTWVSPTSFAATTT